MDLIQSCVHGLHVQPLLVTCVLHEAKVGFLHWSAVQSGVVISDWLYLTETAML